MNRLFKTCVFIFVVLINDFAYATFHKSLWPQWEVNNPLSTKRISHQPWQKFLDQYLITNDEQINLIDYAHLTPDDLASLNKYIQDLSQVDIDDYNRQEQLAYWINLYNALTVQTVAKYYPVANIQEISISPGLFSVGPWGANLITIKNTALTLDDIHNRIIRPIWNDSRTHYAINNATVGSPNLAKQAYQGALIEQQLNESSREYINSLRGAQVIEGKLIISKVYDWF
ncbi:MAG: DUF547 domain-containing protein, partial [Legionella sp.]